MKRILLASGIAVLASVSFGSPAYACWPWDGACQARERAAQQRAQQQAAQRAAAAQRQNQINSNLVRPGAGLVSDNGLGMKNSNNLISNNQNGLLSPGNKTGSSLISPGNKTGSSLIGNAGGALR
jgi:hypothetical protein